MQPNPSNNFSSDKFKDWNNQGQKDERKQVSTCQNTESTKKVKNFSFKTGAVQEEFVTEKDKYFDIDPLYRPPNVSKSDCLTSINSALAWPKNQWTNGLDPEQRPRAELGFNRV